MDAEVFGDDVHVHESEDEQRDGDHADECKHEHSMSANTSTMKRPNR